jgi:hypothetical protein
MPGEDASAVWHWAVLFERCLHGHEERWGQLYAAERVQQRSLHQQRHEQHLLPHFLHGGHLWQHGDVCGGRRVMSDARWPDMRNGYMFRRWHVCDYFGL